MLSRLGRFHFRSVFGAPAPTGSAEGNRRTGKNFDQKETACEKLKGTIFMTTIRTTARAICATATALWRKLGRPNLHPGAGAARTGNFQCSMFNLKFAIARPLL